MATVVNALRLLNLFSQSHSEIGLTQFKERSGFDKGTTHRYLQSLKSLGFLEQNSETKAYRLGPAIMRLAAIREHTFPMAKIAALHVDKLAAKTGELVHVSLLTDEGMSSLYHCDGGISGTRVGFDSSEILPFHATSSGIAMLAFGSDKLLEGLMKTKLKKYTDMTEIDFGALQSTVQQARDQAYSYTNQSFEAEVCSLALPFFSSLDEIAGTLAIATPRSRMTDVDKQQLLTSAIATSINMSAELGAQIPAHIIEKWNMIIEKVETS